MLLLERECVVKRIDGCDDGVSQWAVIWAVEQDCEGTYIFAGSVDGFDRVEALDGVEERYPRVHVHVERPLCLSFGL